MRSLALWAALAASLSANAVIATVALSRRASAAPSPTPAGPCPSTVLSLSGDEASRVGELRSRFMARRAEHAREMARLRESLAYAMAHSPHDRAALDPILVRMARAQAEFQQATVEHVLAVRGVLGPGQRPAYDQMLAGKLRGNSGARTNCAAMQQPGPEHDAAAGLPDEEGTTCGPTKDAPQVFRELPVLPGEAPTK